MNFKLKNLNCANCAAKIERSVNQLPEVKSALLDFTSSRLTVELADTSAALKVGAELRAIVQRIEPEVTVMAEEESSASNWSDYILEGLDCANCAAKMEQALGKLPQVKTARIDFTTKRLVLELLEPSQEAAVLLAAAKIIHSIESGVTLIKKPSEERLKQESFSSQLNLRILFSIFLSGGLLIAGIFLELNPNLNAALFAAAYLAAGYDVIGKALRNLLGGRIFDENFLMTIATVGAFAIGEYTEGVAVMLFYKVGELFQDLAVNRSRNSIAALMDIRPDYANLKTAEGVLTVAPDQIAAGDIILIKPGEKVPLDGVVAEGVSALDTSALTGESRLRDIQPGDEILSGSINKSGLLSVVVTKEFGESTVSKLLDLVQNAGTAKAETENFITKFARFYTPIVVILAALIALVPPLIISEAAFSDWIYKALIFLVISCPCALVISIPLGFFGGIGGASRRGILIKGANYLEGLTAVDTVVFDKTGTLTQGVFSVTSIQPAEGFTAEELLYYAAGVESFSTHPIAVSIVKAYNQPFDFNQVIDYVEYSGLGVAATVSGKKVLAGKSSFMTQHAIAYPEVKLSGTVVHVSIDRNYAGYLVISDKLKSDSLNTVRQLKELGIRKIMMLTGDSELIAREIAKETEIEHFYADLLPQQKLEIVEKLEQNAPPKKLVLFVGDGINDAPVLARSSIGVAMGGIGSDAAIEASDIVLMTDEPSKLVTAIKIAKHTRSIVTGNIALALTVKLLALTLGLLGLATIWEAVIADVGVTILAILNSLRALNTEKL